MGNLIPRSGVSTPRGEPSPSVAGRRVAGRRVAGRRVAGRRVAGRRVGASAVVVALAVGGLLHVLPGAALVAPDRLGDLYGVSDLDPTEQVLLRHRALLLALVGAFLLAAVAQRGLRLPALVAALVSTVVFIALVLTAETSAALRQVAVVDAALLPLLVVAAWISARRPATAPTTAAGR